MLDNFREWLSDNLRYILLGLAILVVLVVLFFGIRHLSYWRFFREREEAGCTDRAAERV